MPIQINNDTKILPGSFTKIPDAISVSGDDNQVSLMQSEKQVRLERLARVFPCPITAESRRRKLQRFLDLPNLTLELIWFPLITYWLATYCRSGQSLSLAIEISQWGCINLFMVSLIWERRAIPLYWSLLPKLGSSNFEEQTTNLQQVLPLFLEYKVIVLGDREFCSVDLGNWLKEKGVSFCLRLKKNHCIETEHLVWQRLDELGIMLWNLFILSRKKTEENSTCHRI